MKGEKQENSLLKDWNTFRHELIGRAREDGKLRICYLFDGWPNFVRVEKTDNKPSITENKSTLEITKVIDILKQASKEQNREFQDFTYKQVRYGVRSTKSEDSKKKFKWHIIDENNNQCPLILG